MRRMHSLVVVAALFCVACAPNYSNGSRVGVVTKLSEKGLIFKSWEGSMLIALPIGVAGSTTPEIFEFNVAPSAVEQRRAALQLGQRVEVVYRQWAFAPLTIDHDHVVLAVKEVQ